jgi:hypothetical protein
MRSLSMPHKRSSLIHPLLPRYGRNLTVLFSPSRRKMKSVLTNQERSNFCICCSRRIKLRVTKKPGRSDTVDTLDDQDLDDEDEEFDDIDDLQDFIVPDDFDSEDEKSEDSEGEPEATKAAEKRSFKRAQLERPQGSGDIVPLADNMCKMASMGIRHFACESCVDDLEEAGSSCPVCKLISNLAMYPLVPFFTSLCCTLL